MWTKIYLTLSLSIYVSLLLYSQDTNKTIPYGIIPMDYRKHIYIKGTVKNVAGNFLFDTGADNLYFDSLFYNKSNLKYDSIEVGKIPGVGKELQQVKVIMNAVQFDFSGLIYQTSIVPIVSLKTILGDFTDGIIGLNYFSNKILEINYTQHYLKIHERIDSLTLCQFSKIQGQRFKDRLYVPVTLSINDTVSIMDKFLIDLGCGSTIVITSPVALKHNLNKVITNKARNYNKYRGVGGGSKSYAFIAKSIEIGGYKLDHFEADYSTDKSGSLASPFHAGLIGNKILERFDVIIDFSANCLYIKPNITFSNTFESSKLGFSFIDRSETLGALIVAGFYENQQAEKSGLLIDDKIIAIDNIPVKDMDYLKQQECINKTKKLILKVERGNEILNIEIIQSQILMNK
jgi:hypothetical protein